MKSPRAEFKTLILFSDFKNKELEMGCTSSIASANGNVFTKGISFIYQPYIPLQVSKPMNELGRLRVNWSAELAPVIDHKDKNYPHKCPRCAGAAYIGLNSIDCKNGC